MYDLSCTVGTHMGRVAASLLDLLDIVDMYDELAILNLSSLIPSNCGIKNNFEARQT